MAIWCRNLRERDVFVYRAVQGRIILKLALHFYSSNARALCNWLGIVTSGGRF